MGRHTWFAVDTRFCSDTKIQHLGTEFGPGGPLAVLHLMSTAKSQDDDGCVTMTYKALAYGAFLKRPIVARQIVIRATEQKVLELVKHDEKEFVARFLSWNDWQQADPTAADRMRRYRQKAKGQGANAAVTRDEQDRNGPVPTSTYTDTEEAKASSSPVAEVKLLPHAAEAISLCETLADLIAKNGSMRPKVNEAWLSSARRLLHRDERPYEEALSLIRWCQADEFWRGNVLSMPTFRKQYDRLRLAAQRNDGRHLKAVDSGRSYERKDLSGYDKFDGEDSA
jgi:hypothetical protein